VLDALLEDGRLAVEAVTGASAGAMNAIVLVEGWLEGGVEGLIHISETGLEPPMRLEEKFKPQDEIFASPLHFFPREITLEGFSALFSLLP
jgi:predicted acylesterase/phospholipase RssA